MNMKKQYISPQAVIDLMEAELLEPTSLLDSTKKEQSIVVSNETTDEFTSRRSIWDDGDLDD